MRHSQMTMLQVLFKRAQTYLTITLPTAKSAELAGTTDLGGQSSNLDGLDIAEGFLNDNAGNASEQAAVNNAARCDVRHYCTNAFKL